MNSFYNNTNNTNNTQQRPMSESSTLPHPDQFLSLLRSIVLSYNHNMESYNHNMESYNHNMVRSLQLLSDFYSVNRATTDGTYRTETRRPTTRRTFRSNSSYSLGIRNPVYTFNIPIRTNPPPTASRLSQEQIDNGTQFIQYNESLGEPRCPISLEDFTPNEQICQIRGCNHIFKTANLMRWFETHIDCPVCRYDLRQWNSNREQNINIQENNEDTIFSNESELVGVHPSTSNQSEPILRSSEYVSNMFSPLLENIFRNRLDNSSQSISSQIISDLIFEQISNFEQDSYDISNNMLYTIEIPLTR